MSAIRTIKAELRHREWREQIQECQDSGKTVTKWCSSNGIKLSTYYTRLKKVREELLSQQPELQKIVPVSVSTKLSDNNVVLQKETGSLGVPMNAEKISIRKNDIEIEIPCNADERIITAILRGLKQC